MDLTRINEVSGYLLLQLDKQDLKPEEKIAALKSCASTIENVLAAEVSRAIFLNAVLGGGRKC